MLLVFDICYRNVGRILAQKGLAYTQLKEYAMALDMFTQYFNFTKEIKDRVEEVSGFFNCNCFAMLIVAIAISLIEILWPV